MIDTLLQRYAHAPGHPGKLRLFRWLYRILKGNGRVQVRVGGDLLMRLSPHDFVECGILFTGWHEPFTTRFLRRNLRPGDTVLIAGAHIGYHVLHAARAVGPAGRVLACEPEPANLLRSREHLRLNGAAGNVTLLPLALGDTAAFVPMDEPPAANTGTAALAPGSTASPYHAAVDRIDALLARLGWPTIDVLLLDIEGFESRALAGLGSHRPRYLVVESDPRHHERLGESQLGFFRALEALGYDVFDAVGGPVVAEGFYPETNLVAVRRDAPAPLWK